MYTIKRCIESILLSSVKTVWVSKKKKKNKNMIYFLIIMCTELETIDKTIDLKEHIKVFFLLTF